MEPQNRSPSAPLSVTPDPSRPPGLICVHSDTPNHLNQTHPPNHYPNTSNHALNHPDTSNHALNHPDTPGNHPLNLSTNRSHDGQDSLDSTHGRRSPDPAERWTILGPSVSHPSTHPNFHMHQANGHPPSPHGAPRLPDPERRSPVYEQLRPSVIRPAAYEYYTESYRLARASPPPEDPIDCRAPRRILTDFDETTSVDEHFRRSLGNDYPEYMKQEQEKLRQTTVTAAVPDDQDFDVSVDGHFARSLGQSTWNELKGNDLVDDHFAKALGDKWASIKAKTETC